MFQSRYAYTDPDIDVGLIRSKIIKEMIPNYDSYIAETGDSEITLIDGYKQYFLRMLDSYSEYRLNSLDYHRPDEDYDYDSPLQKRYRDNNHTVHLPTLRIIYVVPHHRGKGIQKRVLGELKEIADEVGESFALFTEPLILSGYGRETNAVECMAKLDQNNYEPPEDYNLQLWKQRNRMLAAGLTNVKYVNAQITKPYQSFVYINKNAPPEEVALFNELKVHYDCPTYDPPEQSD